MPGRAAGSRGTRMPVFAFDQMPLFLLGLAAVLFLGVEAWRRASARAGACTARLWRVCFRCGTQADILCAIIRARGRPSVRLAKPFLLHVLKRLVTCVL